MFVSEEVVFMEIIDLTEEYQDKFFICLEDWSEEIKEAGNHKELWCGKMKDKGLRVKLAVDNGKVCGMIQYIPVEYSNVEGKDLYFIHLCIIHITTNRRAARDHIQPDTREQGYHSWYRTLI